MGHAQTNYDDFEGSRHVRYDVERSGHLDSAAQNPVRSAVNASARCGKYIRGKMRYDNMRIVPSGKLANVAAYATYEGQPPALKMKVFTNAPVGTLVEVQLAKRGGKPYPIGVHSQYQAITTKSNEWEDLEFKFSQRPKGSLVSDDEVDEIILLFYPNSNTNHVYFFDDLTGPPIR